MKQQSATSEMLRVISNSPIQSVLDAVAENAARLCESNNAEIFRLENNLLRLVASYGEIPVAIHAREGLPANRDRVMGRAACDRRTIHVRDLAAEDSEYPMGSMDAKREGHRTTLATPLLREGTPIGVILIRRWEIRPFNDKQIALLETFADQAVIAIENVRLFEAEKQHTLALAQANRHLAEREANIRRLVEANIIGIFIWDVDGRIVEANESFLRLVQYNREDLVSGRVRWTDLTPEEWQDDTARRVAEVMSAGAAQPREKEYVRRDGSRVPVLIGGAALGERLDRGIAFVVDLTERKRAEEALRQSTEALRRSEAYLAEAQRLSHTGTWVSDGTLTTVYFSKENYRVWGVDPLQGLPSRDALWQRIHPDDRGRVWAGVQEAVRQKRDYAGEFRIVLPDGTIKYLDVTAHHRFAARGELVEILRTNVDVTEGKRAERALRESEEKFRDYAETASDWFWEIGPDYKFTLLSENAFASHSADRIGTACWDHALDLETEPEKWRLVWATLDSRKPFRDFVYRGLSGNGSPMHVRVSGRPVFDSNGEFRGYRGTGTDVTALMRAQEEHERLRRLESDLAHMHRLTMMGELAASLAHEITQPIATARNNARAATRFLDRNPPDLGEVREALACIVDDADRAGDIIDRIRDHIKKAPPRKGRFDLNKAIDEVIALAGSAITTAGVSVQTRLTEGLAPVQGDRVQLQQVVLNLILNAVEAMSTVEARPRELLISTEQTQTGGTLVSVRDSGPGIDPLHVDRVFEAFYTTKSSGVGMGLSICRSIIDAHGGRLWADMNASRGAVFRFTLPGADKELTESLGPAHLTREPHEDTVSDAAHQPAYEGNKRPHR